ncbi:MAG TPA: hypothetical protein VKY22_15850 [Bradyrhizobium sp.]|nr:hypothetical protein [Bradyrhizobium sp.]
MSRETELVEQIMVLPRETAIEAARFVAAEIAADAPVDTAEKAGAWASATPFSHVEDIETLARLVLVALALGGEEAAARASAAIAGTGRQNVVLGGMEIVALAGLGVIALQILLTRGKVTDSTMELTKDKNGKPILKIRVKETPVKLSDSLAAVLRPIFHHK